MTRHAAPGRGVDPRLLRVLCVFAVGGGSLLPGAAGAQALGHGESGSLDELIVFGLLLVFGVVMALLVGRRDPRQPPSDDDRALDEQETKLETTDDHR
ncbi:MAG: hypothetical protein HYY04_13950 [Chloroflexi bacterium]|nr:hypothetical protein [Chloroflexota bacterium]